MIKQYLEGYAINTQDQPAANLGGEELCNVCIFVLT